MRIISLLVWTPLVAAFAPNAKFQRVKTEVAMDRRSALSKAAVLAGIVTYPQLGNAFSQQSDDNWVEPSQQKTDGKLVSINFSFLSHFKKSKCYLLLNRLTQTMMTIPIGLE